MKVDATEVDAMEPFLRGLPKAELHLHLEGTLEPELLFELAGRNHVRLPWAGIDEVRAAYAFTDLQSFLDVYYAACDALRTERDFHDLTLAYLDRVAADGARRVEVFFDPQTHTDRGVPMAAVVEGIVAGLEEGRRRHGISSGLIMCIVRHLPADAAMAVYEAAVPFREHLLGLGMDSGEVGNPPARFVEVFARARADGLHLVAHAGEEGPPAYVTEALDLLQVERIDHGVRSIEDPDLLARLARDRVPLTVCPLSNVALRVVDRLEEHPLPRLLAAGVPVTINSDDPAYFGGYLGDNYVATQAALDLDADTMVAIARTSLEACFVDEDERASLVAQLDGYVAACEPETAGGAA